MADAFVSWPKRHHIQNNMEDDVGREVAIFARMRPVVCLEDADDIPDPRPLELVIRLGDLVREESAGGLISPTGSHDVTLRLSTQDVARLHGILSAAVIINRNGYDK